MDVGLVETWTHFTASYNSPGKVKIKLSLNTPMDALRGEEVYIAPTHSRH
jgi:hypothetical protein